MNPVDWQRALSPQVGGDSGDSDDSPAEQQMREIRRRLGSLGRGASRLPSLRPGSLEHTFNEFRDYLQMMLDQHPYRVLGISVALGAAMGYLLAAREKEGGWSE